VLAIAYQQQRILITNDTDFGELIVLRQLPHAGVILLRLADPPLAALFDRLGDVFTHHADQLGQFLVVTPHKVRVHRPKHH
jgi:predicted nuclease of predicted toxin-antitoxin system